MRNLGGLQFSGAMEEVEVANKLAVEGSKSVLSLLLQPQDQLQSETLTVETRKVVSMFKRVTFLINGLRGHARFKKQKPIQTHLPRKLFLDNTASSSSIPVQLFPRDVLSLCSSEMPLGVQSRGILQVPPQSQSISPFQYVQHQNSQRFHLLQPQHQQQINFHSDLYNRNIKLEGSSCTPTMSSTRSFISSLSMDSSVASLEGNAFRLMSIPQSSERLQQLSKRKCMAGGEGSGKCRISGRCHCPKRRFVRDISSYGSFKIFFP